MSSNLEVQALKQKKISLRSIYMATGIIVSMLCIQGIIMYSTISKYSSRIYPGLWIEDVNVGGKTKEEARKAIIEKHNNIIKGKDFTIKVNDKKYIIDTSKLNMQYNYGDAIDNAFDNGRQGNIFKKYTSIAFANKKVFQLNHTYNYDSVDTVIKNIEKENNIKTVNASLSKSISNEFIINKEKFGYEINVEKLKQDIRKKINNIEEEKDLEIKAELNKVEPKIKENDLKSINSKISSFTTNFQTSNDNRSTNINISANAISGKILMPGDVFSFNDVVGERSVERGYKTATVIIDNKFTDDIGGGICQVSTTLYNAILRANIPSTERIHHSIPSTYVGLGLDATVAYGLLDYKFKNTLSYPIYIESVIENKNITFNVYSNSSLTDKKYDIVNEIAGDKVNVFKVIYEGGKLVSKDLLYTDKLE